MLDGRLDVGGWLGVRNKVEVAMFLVIVSRKLGLPPRKVNLHAAVTPISQIGLVA